MCNMSGRKSTISTPSYLRSYWWHHVNFNHLIKNTPSFFLQINKVGMDLTFSCLLLSKESLVFSDNPAYGNEVSPVISPNCPGSAPALYSLFICLSPVLFPVSYFSFFLSICLYCFLFIYLYLYIYLVSYSYVYPSIHPSSSQITTNLVT